MMYEYWLARVHPLSNQKKQKLRACIGSAKEIYYIEETQIYQLDFLTKKDQAVLAEAKKELRLEETYRALEEHRIRFLPYFDKEYPGRLRKALSPPYALYVKGRLPEEEKVSVAIVGARKCTPYGEEMALAYGERLAEAGIQIISGMARGIDGAAQRGALNGGGRTYGVLGCGVDICYPREHRGLYCDILKEGGLLSEQLPGEPPLAGYFPARNRIISGLSDLVLVMEAKERSGSLITADMALEEGKDVFALPGLATSPMSRGCHRLIAQGAGILLSPEDLLEMLGYQKEKLCQKPDKNEKMLETTENIVYSCLGLYPKGVQSLSVETGLAPPDLIEQLMTLELQGYIKEVSRNQYIKVR